MHLQLVARRYLDVHKSGASHFTARSDLEAMTHIREGLFLVPEVRDSQQPVLDADDLCDYDNGYASPKGPYDLG